MPSHGGADRNLLFGVLALQMDFVGRDDLIQAMHAWALDKAKALGEILVARGALRADLRAVLETLVAKHLERHGGDAGRSLAAVRTGGAAAEVLASVSDPDLQASLARLPAAPPTGSWATRVPSVGAPTGAGERFHILRPLARGGLGEVFVARDEELKREVALKEIQERHADRPESRARFLLEAEVTGGLEHPGIVPVYGLGAYPDGRPFYAMRFIKGDSLKEAIRRFYQADAGGRGPGERTLALRDLLTRFVAVCNAVAYAHSRGVLHRDLKPANVMLGPYGETLVVDWGLAKLVGAPSSGDGSAEGLLQPASASGAAPTQLGSAVGTPGYMSPEQAAGKQDELGPASDVYSLGATLYCLLTGRAPFAGPDVGEVLRRVQRGDFPPPRRVNPAVPAALEAVCVKAMALRPEGRYGAARGLAQDVERWLADEPVGAWREPWGVRARRWARGHRSLVTAAAVLLVAAIVGLGGRLAAVRAEQLRTEEQKQKAEHERDRAEANFDAAKRLSLRLIDITESKWAALPRAERARLDLLEAALGTFEPFLAGRPDDPLLQGHVALLHRYAANLHRALGESGAAERSYRESLRLREALAAGGALEHRKQLAETLRDYSQLQKRLGKLREATGSLRRSAEIAEGLRAAGPGQAHYTRALATALLDLSELEQSRGLLREAGESCRRVAELYRELLAAPGEKGQFDGLFLAAALTRQGACQRDLGRPEEALDPHTEAVRLLRALLAERIDTNRSHFLGRALVEQARTLAKFPPRRAEAERGLDEAVGTWQALGKQSPRVPLYREWQAVALQARGELRLALNRPAPAGEDLDQSRALLEGLVKQFPAVPGYPGHLGRTCGALGRLALARGDAKRSAAWFAQAAAHLRRALEHDPENAGHRAALDELAAEGRRPPN
jgi:serine/threonine-protein kinase